MMDKERSPSATISTVATEQEIEVSSNKKDKKNKKKKKNPKKDAKKDQRKKPATS